jgi:hypothetical protein
MFIVCCCHFCTNLCTRLGPLPRTSALLYYCTILRHARHARYYSRAGSANSELATHQLDAPRFHVIVG